MQSEVPANLNALEMEIVVIKADGTRIPLGVCDAYYKNPLKRLWFKIKKRIWRLGTYNG